MKNETTTKANPVKPNTSSKLNTAHQGICQASGSNSSAIHRGLLVRFPTNKQEPVGQQLNLRQFAVKVRQQPANRSKYMSNEAKKTVKGNGNPKVPTINKPAQQESKPVKSTTIKPGPASSKPRVIRTTEFTLFKKPEIAEEGQQGGTITDVVEVQVTENNVKSIFLEITATLDATNSNGEQYTLVKKYNMSEDARGMGLYLKDYNALTGAGSGPLRAL